MTDLIHVPFHGKEIVAVEHEGQPRVPIRYICEVIGIDTRSQMRKLVGKSWASVVNLTIQLEGDTQRREVATVDRRTLTMWLATINVSQVGDPASVLFLEQLQNEAADALDAYFNEGGAINPNATVEQVDRLTAELGYVKQRAEIIQALRGVVAGDYLDAKGRILLAQAMGERPELEPSKRPLYVHNYLSSRGMTASEVKAAAPQFGKLLRATYFVETGDQPEKAPQEIGGRVIDVYAYTEQHRFLFDRVCLKHFGSVAA